MKPCPFYFFNRAIKQQDVVMLMKLGS